MNDVDAPGPVDAPAGYRAFLLGRLGDDDPAEILDTFEALRRSNLAWSRSSPEDRARAGIRAERGPESLETTFRMIAGHDRVHLEQAGRVLDEVRRD